MAIIITISIEFVILFYNILCFQAARRFSMSVSNKASSVYQFFQDKEELRTAKLTLLVVIVAFICWSPFVAIILCPLVQSNNIVPISEKPIIQAVSKAIAVPKNKEDILMYTLHQQNIIKVTTRFLHLFRWYNNYLLVRNINVMQTGMLALYQMIMEHTLSDDFQNKDLQIVKYIIFFFFLGNRKQISGKLLSVKKCLELMLSIWMS